MISPGTFIAAVGADNQGKQELEPALVVASTLVVDVLEQCAEIGELQHALAARLMARDAVHAELADVVSGRRPGRTREDEMAVYEAARAWGRGMEVAIDE
jgi:ornithine cyclodeaminase/alanine dehydrogenase-like protein (mu-crystallin family)